MSAEASLFCPADFTNFKQRQAVYSHFCSHSSGFTYLQHCVNTPCTCFSYYSDYQKGNRLHDFHKISLSSWSDTTRSNRDSSTLRAEFKRFKWYFLVAISLAMFFYLQVELRYVILNLNKKFFSWFKHTSQLVFESKKRIIWFIFCEFLISFSQELLINL